MKLLFECAIFKLLFFILFLVASTFCNAQTQIVGKSLYELSQPIPIYLKNDFSFKKIDLKSNRDFMPQTVPQYYCYNKLAMFCKLEVKMEKKFQYPIKIRLGTVEQADFLEGKRKTQD